MWLQYLLHNTLHSMNAQLDEEHYHEIMMDNLSKATQAMDDVIRAGVRVDWLDWILQMIHEDREFQLLF